VCEIVAYAFKIAPAPDVRAQRIKYFCDMPLQLSFSWRGLSANGLPQHLRSGAFFPWSSQLPCYDSKIRYLG
jgi:hypothetical protein